MIGQRIKQAVRHLCAQLQQGLKLGEIRAGRLELAAVVAAPQLLAIFSLQE